MLGITYCHKCGMSLSQYGELTSYVFEQVCESYLVDGICFELSTSLHGERFNLIAIVNFLEMKGYVLSTKCDEHLIKVKPLGFECFPQGEGTFWHICLNREKHE